MDTRFNWTGALVAALVAALLALATARLQNLPWETAIWQAVVAGCSAFGAVRVPSSVLKAPSAPGIRL